MADAVYQKYYVDRVSDPTGKHDDCWYFVLDLKHDPNAAETLTFYADSIRESKPGLAADIDEMVHNHGA